MPLHRLVVPLLLKMQLVQVAEMSLVVLHHLLPSHDQILFQEEGFAQFVLMQFPSQQDQVVQQNVPGCGNMTAATEPRPDKNIVLKCGRLCLAILYCSWKAEIILVYHHLLIGHN